MNIVLTLLCALAVGLLLMKAKLPGGMMIGAVVGACAFGLLTRNALAPAAVKTASQILAGAMIGSGISRTQARQMKGVLKPALILMPSLLLVNIAAALLIARTETMDLMTALMSTTPGGISNIPMIAADLGADAAKVTVMQFVRFFMGIALFPTLIGLLEGKGDAAPGAARAAAPRAKGETLWMALTFGVAAACGILGNVSPLPSGTMAFATLGSIAFKCIFSKAWTPKYTGKAAQWLSGAYVGALMGPEELRELLHLPGPALIIVGCYALGAALISFALLKSGCFATRKEALLASTPAGASDMALISADMGVHNPNLVLLQVLRLVVVITVFPTLLSALAGAFG